MYTQIFQETRCFQEKFTQLENFHTTGGRDSRDKFPVWYPEVLLTAKQLLIHRFGNVAGILLKTVGDHPVGKYIDSRLSIDVKREGAVIILFSLSNTLKNSGHHDVLQVVSMMVEQKVKESGRFERGSFFSSA